MPAVRSMTSTLRWIEWRQRMEAEAYSPDLGGLRQRVAHLVERLEAGQLEDLTQSAMQELDTALEELSVAKAEIAEQYRELAAADRLLAAERRRYLELFEFAPDAYLVTDREGIIREANRAASALLQVCDEGLVGKPLVAFIAQPDHAIFFIRLADLRAGYIDSLRGWELLMRPQGGPEGRVVLSVTSMLDGDGRLVGLHWLIRDIRQRSEAEARLAASFAHEVNNPLQTVVGCVALAREALAEGESGRRYLEMAQEELGRVVDVVARFRDVNRRVIDTEKVPTDVNQIVADVLAHTATRSGCLGVEVVWQPEEEIPPVLAAADQLRRAFLNLILNAIDAMPGGGQLAVSTSYLPAEEEVGVTFSDAGMGIPSDLFPHLFEPFFTTKSAHVGLGLYVSRNVVEQHGGRIEVVSKPEGGFTFIVHLPA